MRTISLTALSLVFVGGPALADDVTMVPTAPQTGIVIHHDADPGPDATDKTVVIHKEDGCATKTVTKSDNMGNSVSRTKTNC